MLSSEPKSLEEHIPKLPILLSASAILALTAPTFAAPCHTGTAQDRQASSDKSSNADRSARNLAGGQQPSSAKTVGAMNNVGANELPAGQA